MIGLIPGFHIYENGNMIPAHGSSNVIVRITQKGIGNGISLLIFAVLMTIQKKWNLLKGLSAKEWGYFALLGLLNPVAYYLVLFKAYDLLPAQVAQPV